MSAKLHKRMIWNIYDKPDAVRMMTYRATIEHFDIEAEALDFANKHFSTDGAVIVYRRPDRAWQCRGGAPRVLDVFESTSISDAVAKAAYLASINSAIAGNDLQVAA